MAKVLFSVAIADMRNKIGGAVYARNRYGAYSRNKTIPSNPRTAKQDDARNKFKTLSTSWQNLTEEQRQSWIRGAKNFPFIDVFGQSRILAPHSLYIGLNTNLATIGSAPITTIPTPIALPQISSLIITSSAAAGTVVTTGSVSPVPNGFGLSAWITPNLSPGIYFARKYYRFSGATGTLYDWTSHSIPSNIGIGNYGTLLEAPVQGKKIFVKLMIISQTSGQMSVPMQASCIVTA
jgi:hypothetical protein